MYGPERTRILIVDDSIMARQALRALLEHEGDLKVVGEAASAKEAIAKVAALAPEILLMNPILPDMEGSVALRRITKDSPQVRTILMGDCSNRQAMVEALKIGARGLLPMDTTPALMFKSIRAVIAGELWVCHRSVSDLIENLRSYEFKEQKPGQAGGCSLTRREIEVVNSVVDGYTNKEIARKFAISEQTVKHHLTSIFGKVGVNNRLELALFAMHQSFECNCLAKSNG